MLNIHSILISEDYANIDNTLKYYGKVKSHKISRNGVEIPFIFYMAQEVRRSYTAPFCKKAVEYCIEMVNHFAKGEKIHPNWIVSSYVDLFPEKFHYFIL